MSKIWVRVEIRYITQWAIHYMNLPNTKSYAINQVWKLIDIFTVKGAILTVTYTTKVSEGYCQE